MSARSRPAGAIQLTALFITLAGLSAGVAAQEGSDTPMGQGQANINVRSDVTLGIEGARSTPNHRLQQIAESATDQMPNLRKCYRELSAKRPTAAGAVAVRLTLEAGQKNAGLELKERPGTDAEVSQCVKRILSRASWAKVERPAAALITLEFDNSRARGEQAMAEARTAAEKVDLRPREGGGFEAAWTAPDGKVGFVVSNPASAEGIEAALRTLRQSFAAFADCRRRSEQGGRSPVGSLAVELRVRPRAKSEAKVLSSSVAHPRAVPCVERAVRGMQFDGIPSPQTLGVQVEFGAAPPSAAGVQAPAAQ